MKVFVFFLAILLSGCATRMQMAERAVQEKRFADAERMYSAEISAGKNVALAWNNLGVVYMRSGRPQMAVKAYTMAARYGDPVAQQNLVSMKLPVPPADLAHIVAQRDAERRAANNEALVLLLGTAAAAQQQRPPVQAYQQPQQVNCTSTPITNVDGSRVYRVETNCR